MPAEEQKPNIPLIPWERSRQSRTLVSPRKPPNLPALCLYLPKCIYLAQLLRSTIYPKGEVEAPASGKEFCIFPFLISAQDWCPGLCFQPYDTGTAHTYPKGAKPLHLHSVGLLEPPNLLDLVHQVPTIHIFHHKIQAILREKEQAISTRIIRAGNLQGSGTGPEVSASCSL